MKAISFQQTTKRNTLLSLPPTIGLLLLSFLLTIPSVQAQKPSDSLILATDGEINTSVVDGNFLYLAGGFNYIGKKTGPVAFFLNGSSSPAKGMPIFGDLRPDWGASDRINAVLPDGAGGWFMAGHFYRVNGNSKTHNKLVHVLPDKTIDNNWDLNWESGGHINVLKKDGHFLYVGGTMSIKDASGNMHAYVCRVDLQTKQVDPVWNPQFTGASRIEKIEIGSDKVILSGWVDKVDGYQQDALVILDKVTGKRLSFPTTSSVTSLKLMGDTLLIGQPSMYWSKYPDGFGYIVNGLALLDKDNDFPKSPQPIAANFYATVPDGSGGWYAAGHYNRDGIFHFDKDFKEVTGFSENLITSVGLFTRLLLHGNSLYVARGLKSVDVNGTSITSVYKLNAATGEIDTGFHPNPNGDVKTVLAKGDTLFIGGTFDTVAGEFRPGLAALNATTGALLPWKPEINFDNFEAGYTGPERFINSLLLKNDTLYVAGKFQVPAPQFTEGGTGIYGLVRYNLQTGDLDTTFHIHTSYHSNPLLTGMAFHGNQLYLVGSFNLTRNEISIKNAGIINLSTKKLSPVNPDLAFSGSSNLPQVAVVNNHIYFWGIGATRVSTGEKREYFVSLNGADNSFTDWNPLPSYNVNSFSEYGGKLLLSGDFYFLKHYPNNFGGIDLRTGKYVNFPNIKTVYTLAATDKYIFLGGDFTYYKDSVVNGLCRLKRNDLSFTSFHHGIMNNTSKAAVGSLSFGTNGLYVVGYYSNMFNLVNGAPRQNICLLDPETAHLKAWNPPPFNGKVYRVFSFGKDAVIAGEFSLMPAWQRTGLAKIDLTNDSLTSWNPVLSGYYPHVYSLLVSGDTVYLGGDGIGKINGKEAADLSAVSASSGTLLTGFAPVKIRGGYGDNVVNVLAKQGKYLYAAGDFKKVNDTSHNCIVKLNAATGKIQSWDPKLDAGWNPVQAILPVGNDIYIGGKSLQIENDARKGFLIKVKSTTGTLEKLYRAIFSNSTIRSLAINDNGTLAAAVNQSKGLYLLDKTRDSLIPVKNLPEFNDGLSKISSRGNLFFSAGNGKKEFGSYTDKPGFLVYSPDKDTVITSFSTPVMQGNINTFATNNNTLIFAGAFAGMNTQITNSNIAFMQMPELVIKPTVTRWSPHKANTTDLFAVTVYGSGFSDNSQVKLILNSKSNLADSLSVTDNRIIAWFNGTDFTPGDWDLQVKVNDNLTQNFAKAVNMFKAKAANVWVDWIGRNRILANKPGTYYVLFGNKGDQDAYGVYLYVATDDGQTVQFPEYVKPPKSDLVDWDTIPHYIESDYFLGEPFKGRVYTVFLPYLPKGYEGSFKLTIASKSATHHLRVAISKPIFKNFSELTDNGTKSANGLGYSFVSCMYSVAGLFADLTPGIECIKAALDNTIVAAIDKHEHNESIQAEDVAYAIGMTALGCIPGEAALSTGWKIAKGLASMYSSGSDASGAVSACGGFLDHLKKLYPDVVAVSSLDPNGKFGPQGANASPYVRSDKPYSYMVSFENDSTATAPAQRVIITDTLDKSVFDLSTFKAVGFGFGDTTYQFKKSDGDTVNIDLRPDKQAIVQVYYRLDKNSGILTWTFQTLDPNTYQPVEGVYDGFLPPDKKSPEGEGNILYSISPLAGLTEGTEIKNSAHIVFDWNNAIPTDTWKNVTDNIAPESAVEALPEYEVDKDFTVKWKGSDAGSGIFSYTVFVSENDSAYYPWITDTHDTSAVFSGDAGVTYKFYTVASDSAGNKEATPGIYDAKTRVSGTGIDKFGEGNKMQFRLFPNPAKDKLSVNFYLPESSEIRLDIISLCGRPVMKPVKTQGMRGINKTVLDISRLPAGYYFVRILTRYGVQTRKVVVQ